MATKNDITGDALVSRNATKAYLDNYDLIFRKEKPQKEKQDETKKPEVLHIQTNDK
jgi:hypothetical protein